MNTKARTAEEEIDERLESIEKEAAQIMEFFRDGRFVALGQVGEVQERFRMFKEFLKSEYKRMATNRGRISMSELETCFYYPAIQDAWANTRLSSVRWNSRPSAEWFNALFEVDDYMAYWRSQLDAT